MKTLWDKYLEKNCNKEIILYKNETLLHYYCSINNIEECKNYLQFINYQDFRGNTPLMIACLKGNLDLIKLLMANNADIRLKDFNGRDYYWKTFSHENNTPKKYEDIVKFLELNRFYFYEKFHKILNNFYNYLKLNELENDLKEIKFDITLIHISFKSQLNKKHIYKICDMFNKTLNCEYELLFTIREK